MAVGFLQKEKTQSPDAPIESRLAKESLPVC
jgi:hypothetical protein